MDYKYQPNETEKKIDKYEAEKEAYLAKYADEKETLLNANQNKIVAKEGTDSKGNALKINERLFKAREYQNAVKADETINSSVERSFDLDTVLQEVNGIQINARKKDVISAKKKLIKKIKANRDAKTIIGSGMKKVLARHVVIEPDLTRTKLATEAEQKKSANGFDKFAYSKLSDYKTDKDFVVNYEKIMKELNHQIEEGYISRRHYYEHANTKSDDEKYLKAMAKTATLERVKAYMELRATLVSNVYYTINDTAALFKLKTADLEVRLAAAERSDNKELALFLHTLISIKYLGFKPDGTGRREVEKQILEDNREQWLKERTKVAGLANIDNKIAYLEDLKKQYQNELTIRNAKEAESKEKKDLADKLKKEAEEEKLKLEAQAKELVKANREEWLELVTANCDLEKFGCDKETVEALKDYFLMNLAENYLQGDLEIKDNQHFRAVIATFENRILQKQQRITDIVNNDKDMITYTYGRADRKNKISGYLLRKLMDTNELFKADDKVEKASIRKYVDDDFKNEFYDKTKHDNYKELVKKYPGLLANKEAWNSELGLKLLDGDKSAKTDVEGYYYFYSYILKGMLKDAIKDGVIKSYHYLKYYDYIMQVMEGKWINAPMEVIKGQIAYYINNPITRQTKAGKVAPDMNTIQYKKWSKKDTWNPVDALKPTIDIGYPDIFSLFEGAYDEFADCVLEAMKNCPEVIRLNGNIARFTNAQELGELSYIEFEKATQILLLNYYIANEKYNIALSGQSPYVQKRLVTKFMSNSAVNEEEIDKIVSQAEQQEMEEAAELQHKKDALVSRLFSTDDTKKELSYDYRNVRGTKLFAEKLFGIRVRRADFKVSKRFENILLSEKIWKKIEDAGDTKKVTNDILAGKKLTDVIKYDGITEDEVKRCEAELRLFGQAREILGRDGLADTALLQYSDSDYKDELSKIDLSRSMVLIEGYLENKYDEKNASDKAEMDKLRSKLRNIAVQFKQTEDVSDYDSEMAEKENVAKLGFASFKDFIYHINLESNLSLKDISAKRDAEIAKFRGFRDGILAPVLPYLLRKEGFAGRLIKDNDDSELEAVYNSFKPFLEALKEYNLNGESAFILEQYLNNNFDHIYDDCFNKSITKEDWFNTFNDFGKEILSTQIAGRGSINEIMSEFKESALKKHKDGITIFLRMITNYPEMFKTMVENPEEFRTQMDSFFKEYIAKDKIVDKIVNSSDIPHKYAAKQYVLDRLKDRMFAANESFDDSITKSLIEGYCEVYKLQVANDTAHEDAVKQAEERVSLVEARRKEFDETKKSGVEADKDLQALLSMEEDTLSNPYIYLSYKNILKSRADKKGQVSTYNKEQASACRAVVDSAILDMKHSGELPESLIRFMSEVVFAEKNINVKQEVRYLISVYRAMAEYYKYGTNNKYDNVNDVIERACVYHYIHNTDHSIDPKAELIYKHIIKNDATDTSNTQNLSQTQAGGQSVEDTRTQREKDDERLEKFLNSKLADLNLSEGQRELILDELNDREKKAEKKRKKDEEKKEKERKKQQKELEKAEKFEKKHPEYLIAKLDAFKTHEMTDDFDTLYELNLSLQTMLKENIYAEPAIKSEFIHFLKNIQLSMYSMPASDFIALVERRVKYFNYAQNVYEQIRDSLRKHYDPNGSMGDSINGILDTAMPGYREYFRLQILNDLEAGESYDSDKWKQKIGEVLGDVTSTKAINSDRISLGDFVGGARAFSIQPGYDYVEKFILDNSNEELIKDFMKLDSNEKVLFVAALSIANKSDSEEASPSCGFIEKDGSDSVTMDKLKEAFESYITGQKFDVQIDFQAALKNLTNADNKIDSNAFKAALTVVEGARAQKDEVCGLEPELLGNSEISLEYAAKSHRIQAVEAEKRHSRNISEFYNGNLLSMISKDLKASDNGNLRIRANNAAHAFIEGVNKKELAARLANLSSEERKMFVMLLQDRTVLDYKSENREEMAANGIIIEHVNEEKRALIKAEYLANFNTRGRLLAPANSEKALNNAMNTLLSFQLRDGVSITGNLETDYVESSINRNTLLDWELIKRAFEFMDELTGEVNRQAIISEGSKSVKAARNLKASNIYNIQKAKAANKTFDDEDFLALFNSEELKDEMTDEHKDLIDGFNMLTESQKTLFFRALQDREILDISNKNSVKNIILGTERVYVNAPKRYALIDEYIERSRSEFAAIDVTENMQFNAIRSLLSTQIDDSLDFAKMTSEQREEAFKTGRIFINANRSTAIDWNLFANALQFVARAENEKKVKYNDEALMRTMGKVKENGDFTFSNAFLRRNIHTSVSRSGAFAMSRIRARVKQYIPDTGNLRTIMSHILSINAMNTINDSGFLAKAGETGAKVNEGMKAMQIENLEAKQNSDAPKLEEATKTFNAANEVFLSATEAYENAKQKVANAKNDLATRIRQGNITNEEIAECESKIKEFEAEEELAKKAHKDAKAALEKPKAAYEKLDGEVQERKQRIAELKGLGQNKDIEPEQVLSDKLDEKQLTKILTENSGLNKYAEMTEVITNIIKTLKIGEDNEAVNKQIAALTKANEGILNLITLFKSDKSIMDKLAVADIDALMGLATLEGEEFGYKEELETFKKHYDSVMSLRHAADTAIRDILSNKDILDKCTDIHIDGLVDVIAKYKDGEYYGIIKSTARNAQNFAKKLGRSIINYTKDDGEANKQFLDPEQNLFEQLGIDSVFDIVSDFTSMNGNNVQATEAIIASKQLTIDAGKVIQQIMKSGDGIKVLEKNLADSRAELQANIDALEAKKASIGTEEQELDSFGRAYTEEDYDFQIEALKASQSEKEESLKKAKAIADVKSTEELAKLVNLADVGRMISAFLDEKSSQAVEKYSAMLNNIKDQAAELYRTIATSKDTKDFFSQFSLTKLTDALALSDNKYIKMTGKFVNATTAVVQNGFNLITKNITGGKLELNGTTLRQNGETKTKKLNEYGELENRSATEVLDQVGVDEAFEIAKIIAIADSSGKSLKYITATQNLKTEVATMVDNVNKLIANGSYANIKSVTDIDGCVNALNSIIAIGDTEGKTAELRADLEKALKVKTEVLNVFEAMRGDGNFLEKLNKLSVAGLLDLVSGANKNSVVGALRDIVKETKALFDATYGTYNQAKGLIKAFTIIPKDKVSEQINDVTDTLFGKLKDNNIFGKKIQSLHESGALKNGIKAGWVVKENIQGFVDIVNASIGIHTLRTEADELDMAINDLQDMGALKQAVDAQDSMVSNEDVKLSEGEKQNVEEARQRNIFMAGQGVDYAYMDNTTKITEAAINMVASVSKVTFDPTGISGALITEAAQIVSFAARVFTDNSTMKEYFIMGPGKSYINTLRIERARTNKKIDDDTLVEVARRHLGMTDDMEFRTFLGRNIVSSILFSASAYNPLKGTRARAEAVLKSIGLSDLVGQTDEAAAMKLYSTLIGTYGLDMGEVTKSQVSADGNSAEKVYRHLKTVKNGLSIV